MKKTILLTFAFIISFLLGFFLRPLFSQSRPATNQTQLKKVTGIGGLFFKCKDPEKIREWYSKHLGFKTDRYGTNFQWREVTDPSRYGSTQWSPFSDSTRYFEPSVKDFMVNYRVENLVSLVADLKKEGVTICDTIETSDYGKFIHVLDIEGNKIELWEPGR